MITIQIDDIMIRAVFMVLILFSIGVGLYNALKIREIHLSMNSRLDQLLVSATGEAHAAGILEGRGREIADQASTVRQEELDEAAKEIKARLNKVMP